VKFSYTATDVYPDILEVKRFHRYFVRHHLYDTWLNFPTWNINSWPFPILRSDPWYMQVSFLKKRSEFVCKEHNISLWKTFYSFILWTRELRLHFYILNKRTTVCDNCEMEKWSDRKMILWTVEWSLDTWSEWTLIKLIYITRTSSWYDL